jgi:SWI/SNF-related matrix-associated actin-dependent regulator 1 of chromatin subfamily A
MFQIFLESNEIVAKFDYNTELIDKIKSIPGAKWHKQSRTWRIPLDQHQEIIGIALDNFGQIEPGLLKFGVVPPAKEDELRLNNTIIELNFAYDPVKVRAVKQIPGVTWSKKTKGWIAPQTSLVEAVEWAARFGIPVNPETMRQAEETILARETLINKSRETDADLDVAGLPLLPYQAAGVAYAANAKRCFIADDMGLGKTLQAIATLEHLNETVPQYPAVIVCPATLVLNWAKEYEKWLPERKVATIRNRKDFPAGPYDILIVGYPNISAWENQLKNHRAYIFDESHYVKTFEAKRTKSAIKIAKTVPDTGAVLCLTGTPVTNRPAEYAPQLEIIGKIEDFGGRWGFYRRYCAAFLDRFGQWNISGHSNLEELNDRLRGNCYIRRTKDQVLHDLPPVVHNKVIVEGVPSVMAEYRKADADIVKYLMDRAAEIAAELGLSPGSAAVRAKIRAEKSVHLVRIGTLRRIAARAKMAAISEMVENLVQAGEKVVVAAHHREIVDDLASKWGNLKIQGQMLVEQVESDKSRFQDLPVEDAPVIVLSIQAAKTGHTLTASQNVVFVELPWTPADVDQTYSRCHRLGQRGSVTATYVLCEGTIDEMIYGLIDRKRSVLFSAVDGGVGEVGVGDDVLDLYLDSMRF